MTHLFGYIFRQTLWPSLFFLLLLAGIVWLSQGLRMLDMVINRGQTAFTFLELTLYVLPNLLTFVLPIAVFCAVLYTLNRLYTDSEIVVMWAAGLSRWAIAAPVITLAFLVTLVGYLLNLYLMPLGYRAMKDRVYEIRADIATGLFREGAFTHPIRGLTVYVREVSSSGELKGIFVQDSRDPEAIATHMAEGGRLVRTLRGPMLIMRSGSSIRYAEEAGGEPLFIEFAEHQFLPEEFSRTTGQIARDYTERYLTELLFPDESIAWEKRNRGRLISEGHMRLATPLYNLVLPMIALVALLCGDFSRRGFALRISIAVGIAVAVRLLGVAAHSAVQDNLALAFLHYLVPVGAIAACALALSGLLPRLSWRRPGSDPPAPASPAQSSPSLQPAE